VKKRKSNPDKGQAWPKPDIKGAIRAPQPWFLDSAGDVDMAKKRRRKDSNEEQADPEQNQPGEKARKRLNIKGSLHEHAKIDKIAQRIKTGESVRKKKSAKPDTEAKDLWGEEPDLKRPESEWLAFTGTSAVPNRYKKKAKMAPEKSVVPAVVVAHSGASVKPVEDHRKALEDIATGKELTRLDAKEAAETARSKKKMEMLKITQLEDEDEQSDEEETELTHRKVENNKMTQAQRNKKKRQAELEAAAKTKKADKARLKQVNRSGELIKDLKKEKNEIAKKQAEVKAHQAEVAKQVPKRLGKKIYEETRPEVKLIEEVPKHLRSLEVEGNLFRDRFESMQKRNIIEPRAVIKKNRRYKEKVKHYINDVGLSHSSSNHLEKRHGPRQTLSTQKKGRVIK